MIEVRNLHVLSTKANIFIAWTQVADPAKAGRAQASYRIQKDNFLSK